MRVSLIGVAVLASTVAIACQDAAKPTSPDILPNGAPLASGAEQTTICHVTGRENNARFIELTASGAARAAHLDERGAPRSGHDGDYLVTARTPCPPPPTPPNVRICKAVNADILLSRFFDFDVNGEATSIRGSTCVDRTFRVGTQVRITEAVAASADLTSITITPQLAGTGNIASTSATIVAGTDLAEVIFGNSARFGQLMICKQVQAAGLVGKQFEFIVMSQGIPTQTFFSPPAAMTAPGACVVAGTYLRGTVATVLEVVGPGTTDLGITTTSISTVPADRLVPGSVNLVSRRASVTIGEGTTQIRFVNARPVGSLEICNVTPPGFTGASHVFVDAEWSDGLLAQVNVPANTCVSPQPVWLGFLMGYVVRIGEVVPAGLRVDALTVDPPDHLMGTPYPTLAAANVLIGAGTTRVTFRHVFVTP